MNERSRETMEPGPYPQRPGEQDCSYYIRTGLCKFGETCRYNHPPNRNLAVADTRMNWEFPERVGQPECQYYLKTGTCKFGGTCKFHHPREKAGISGRVPLNSLGYPLRPNETECAYYLRTGQCKFGSTCKFHHPQPNNTVLSLRGSPATPSQQSYPLGITNWSRGSYVSSPRWQGPSSYTPMIMPQGMVSVPGWNVYSGSTETNQQAVENSQIHGASRQNETQNGGSQGSFSPYGSSSIPIGFYAVQRENIFPERPGEPECQYYMKTGDCKFGAVCKFHHPRERMIPAPDCLLSPLGLPLRPGEPMCIFYSRYGICKFGPSCKFDHPMGIFAYNPAAPTSAAAPARRSDSSSSAPAMTLSSEGFVEAGSGNPRRLSLSETRQMTSDDNGID